MYKKESDIYSFYFGIEVENPLDGKLCDSCLEAQEKAEQKHCLENHCQKVEVE